MQVTDKPLHTHAVLDPIDAWAMDKMNQTIDKVNEALADYRFDLATYALYEFTWHTFCDWYLELAKPMLSERNESHRASTTYVLLMLLEKILCMLHPFMPFITESIWQKVAPHLKIKEKTIMLREYPKKERLSKHHQEESQEIEWINSIISSVRNVRSEMNIPPQKTINALLKEPTKKDLAKIKKYSLLLNQLAKIESIETLEGKPPLSATALSNDVTLLIPLEGLIDINEEKTRIEKNMQKLMKELEKTTQKLNNKSYTEKAPKEVVEKERTRKTEIEKTLEKLKHQFESLAV